LLLFPAFATASSLVTQTPFVDSPPGTVGLGFGLRGGDTPYRDIDNVASMNNDNSTDLVPLYLYNGKWFFFHGTSAGVHLLDQGAVSVDAVASYRFDRLETDASPFYAGMEDREQTVDGGLSIAELIAVYPTSIRAGVGFGGGMGHGLVFRDGHAIGRTSMYQVSVGANVGGQVYRQILFFKSEAAFQRLMDDAMEFAGQANLAVVTAGDSATPSFNTEVAMFTQLRSGLLVEGSVGAHGYWFRPLTASGEQRAMYEDAKNESGR
jgi:hypothetical protein